MLSFKLTSLSLLPAILMGGAFAHGIVTQFGPPDNIVSAWDFNTDPYQQPPPDKPTRKFDGNGPIQDVTSPDITCNVQGGIAAGDTPVQTVADGFAAGDAITFWWTPWPDSHKGPVMTYLADCNGDCTTFDSTTGDIWFKIDEAGYDVDTDTWAADTLIANNNTWISTIPSDIAPGEYLLRHEILALHSASSPGGAQFYPSCNQISITGSGTNKPSGVALPGAYKADDPGILINIYEGLTSYTIPGPPVVD